MVLVAALIGIVLLLAVALIAVKILGAKKENEAQQEEPVADQIPQARRGRGGGGRLRNRARRRQAQEADSDEEGNSDDDSMEEDEAQDVAGANRNTRIAARREERRRQRQEEREAELEQREARETKISAYEERQQQKEAEREERERLEEEERAQKAEERRKQEEEEAAKWREFISVDETGEVESEEQVDGLLQRFVDVIKERKMAVLEDLAAEFQLRTQEVVQRIEQLEKMGRITGVMDDRGKFIYVSREEMEKVADFIRSRGRIPISELAHTSNKFVDLEVKAPVSDLPEIDFTDLQEEPQAV